MKGYVIRKSDGRPLVYGERAEGTKVARLADDPAHEFVPADDERAPQLEEAMRPKPRAPQPTLADVVACLPQAVQDAIAARVAARR